MYRALLILALTVCTFFSLQTEPVNGKDIPFIVRIDLLGLEAKLAANKGKVVILDFWLHN